MNSLQYKIHIHLPEKINHHVLSPVALKQIRDVFRLFRKRSGRVIVLLFLPQTLKNDFMLMVVWSKENGTDWTFPLDNKHPIFPGSVSRERCYNRTVSWAAHHWSLLMQTVSGAFFIREGREKPWHPPLMAEEATWSKFRGGVYAKAITLCLGSLPWELDCSAATEWFTPQICHSTYTSCHM